MGKHEKTLLQVLRGASDASISFEELCKLLRHLGIDEHIRGSHYIFTKEGVQEILDLPPKSAKAKA